MSHGWCSTYSGWVTVNLHSAKEKGEGEREEVVSREDRLHLKGRKNGYLISVNQRLIVVVDGECVAAVS